MIVLQTIKEYFDRRTIVAYCGALVAYMAMWLTFAIDVNTGDMARVIRTAALRGVMDYVLMFAPCLIFWPRWRWMPMAILWLTGAWLFAETCYCHFFGDVIPLRTLGFVGNLDTLTFNSVFAVVRPRHWVFLVAPLGYTILYLSYRPKDATLMPCRQRLWLFAPYAMIAIVAQTYYLYPSYKYAKANDLPFSVSQALRREYAGPLFSYKQNINYIGLPAHLLVQSIGLISNAPETYTLTDADRAQLDALIADRRSLLSEYTDSVNIGKNLIFIIVESLNAEAVGATLGDVAITPTLDSLIDSGSTLWCKTMVSQTGNGASSDGQLMYNTGLLPLRDRIVAMDYTDNSYVSIADQLGRYSVEVIYEQPTMWNHHITTRQYGYDNLYWSGDMQLDDNDGKDLGLFKFVIDKSRELPKPFFIEVTTLSMHAPYRDAGIEVLDAPSDMPAIMAHYLSACKYFDSCLAYLIDGLKTTGQYDDTVIVLASDHNARFNLRDDEDQAPIFFMAINGGATGLITAPMSQVDVFPTVLDLMGADPAWPGVGRTMLTDRGATTFPIDSLSAKIIESNALAH